MTRKHNFEPRRNNKGKFGTSPRSLHVVGGYEDFPGGTGSPPPDDEGGNGHDKDEQQCDDDQATIERLARLSNFAYDRVRGAEAKRLGIGVKTLDAAVEEERASQKAAAAAPEVVDIKVLEESAEKIISSESVLDVFATQWRKAVAGEVHNARLLYLIATSRLFDKTMHAAIKGASSGGKSEIRGHVLKFFPPEDVISFTVLSPKSLLYFQDDFQHKILSMGEAVETEEQAFQDYLLRELMSEGKLKYPVVTKIGNIMTTIIIEKNGPVSFFVTTTRTKLHQENETRMLSLEIDDSEGQTKKVLGMVARVEGMNTAAAAIDYKPWHDFQRWLRAGNCRVAVPFSEVLSMMIPPRSVRLRRDFGQLLRAVKAHTLLHRKERPSEGGAAVADIELDYRPVKALMENLLAENSGVAVSKATRETIAALAEANKDLPSEDGATAKTVGDILNLDKSAARRRLIAACQEGFVANLETRRGHAGRYRATGEKVIGEEMLPEPEQLQAAFDHEEITS
jgi:hypothetical protein